MKGVRVSLCAPTRIVNKEIGGKTRVIMTNGHKKHETPTIGTQTVGSPQGKPKKKQPGELKHLSNRRNKNQERFM